MSIAAFEVNNASDGQTFCPLNWLFYFCNIWNSCDGGSVNVSITKSVRSK
jgi:hypothetical protein